jgi:hypothetical protein
MIILSVIAIITSIAIGWLTGTRLIRWWLSTRYFPKRYYPPIIEKQDKPRRKRTKPYKYVDMTELIINSSSSPIPPDDLAYTESNSWDNAVKSIEDRS